MRLKILITLALSLPCFAYPKGLEDQLHSDNEDTDIDAKIMGGEDARVFNFPYHASLQVIVPEKEWSARSHVQEIDLQHICSVSILSEYWVVTAAHCVYEKNKSQLRVVAGVRSWPGPRKKKDNHKVEAIFIHENFTEADGPPDSDIALIRLQRHLKFAKRVESIDLPSADYVVPPGMRTTVTGWGTEAENEIEIQEVLQSGKLVVVNHAECKQIYAGMGITITNNMFCASSKHTGVCKGDDGGPLVLRNGNLAGILSWYYNCGDPDFPVVFTDVAKYVEWIKNTMCLN